jgi:hypothetical protein
VIVTVKYSLASNDVLSGATLDPVSLTQKHTLSLEDIVASTLLDAVEISSTLPTINLVVAELLSETTLDTANPTQKHTLSLVDVASSTTLDPTNLTQKHALAIQEVTSSATLDPVDLVEAEILTVNDATSSATLDPVVLTQKHIVTGNDLSSATTLDATNPIQKHSLTVNDVASEASLEAVVVTAHEPAPPWYHEDWSYRVKITVDATKVAANVTDFPVYVDLSNLPSGFHSNVNQTDARDIRVTTADAETEVPREVVFYDAATDTGELHFKAPSLSSSTDTDFYIYYGNTSASDYGVTDTYGRNNVWISGYSAVWHMQEGSSTRYDSTSNGNNLTPGTTINSIASTIGLGADFVRSNGDYMWSANSSSTNMGTSNFTVSIIAKLDTPSINATTTFVNALDDTVSPGGSKGWTFGKYTDNKLFIYISADSSNFLQATGTTLNSTNTYHLAMARGGNTVRQMFVNGSLETSGTVNSISGSVDNVRRFNIGEYHHLSENFDGILTEIRIFKGSNLGANYLLTESNNLQSASTFYEPGAEESFSGSLGLIPSDATSSATLDNVSITQKHTLSVNDLTSSATLDATNLSQHYTLTVNEATSATTLDAVNLTQATSLSVNDVASTASLDPVTLTQKHIVTGNEVNSATTLDAANLTQKHNLVVADLTSSASLDAVELTEAEILTVADATSTSTLDAANLIQKHQLTVADVASTTTIDTPTLLQAYTLTLEDVVASTLLDAVEVSATAGTINLIVADLLSETTLDAVETTTGKFTLTPASITSTTTLKRVKLTGIPINGAEIIILTNGSIAVKLDNYTYELI